MDDDDGTLLDNDKSQESQDNTEKDVSSSSRSRLLERKEMSIEMKRKPSSAMRPSATSTKSRVPSMKGLSSLTNSPRRVPSIKTLGNNISGSIDFDSINDPSEMGSALGVVGEMESAADQDSLKELEKLQLATIYSLVEEIEMSSGLLHLLFLTNDQAKQFDFTDIDKVTRAMNIIPKPKLIININKSMSTLGSTAYYDSSGITGCPADAFSDFLYVAEPNKATMVETEQRLAMFLKENLLPVCIKTNAVVFIHNDMCAISRIFGSICKAEQSKRNGFLPFTVCSVSGGHSVSLSAEYDPTSVAYQICRHSKRWQKHSKQMLSLFEKDAKVEEIYNDFTDGLTHAIVISSVDGDGRRNVMPSKTFKSDLVTALSRELPSVGLVSMYTGQVDPITLLSEYVGRKLPLVLIDCRNRPPVDADSLYSSKALEISPTRRSSIADAASLQTTFYDWAKSSIETIDGSLGDRSWNFYQIATISFLHSTVAKFSQVRLGMRTVENHRKWLYLADIEKRNALEMEASDGQEEPPEHVLAKKFVSLLVERDQIHDKKRRVMATSVLDDFLEEIENCTDVETFDDILRAHTLKWAQSNYFVQPNKEVHCEPKGGYNVDMFWNEYPTLFERVPFIRDGRSFAFVAAVRSDVAEEVAKGDDGEGGNGTMTLDHLIQAAHDLVSDAKKNIIAAPEIEWPMIDYMAVFDLITSPFAYSGNLSESRQLGGTLAKIARIDRLPESNTLSALNTIRFCWDAVDVCNHVADQMKTVSKVSYVLLLILGVLIGALTVVSLNLPELINSDDLNTYVVVGALISGIIAGVINQLSPNSKWTRLRGTALAIESEIWRFRTRSGIYMENSEKIEQPEDVLRNRTESIKIQGLKSAGVLGSYFMSLFEVFESPTKVALFTHGQYKGCGVTGSFAKKESGWFKSVSRKTATEKSAKLILKSDDRDDFHSPSRPADYLAFRVQKQLRFYQARLPVYDKIKFRTSVFLILGTFSGVLFGLLNLTSWTAIMTGVVGGVTAWAEFHGTEDKINRYSDAVSQLDSIVLWWNTLSAVDQASMANVSNLVDRCETVFKDERQAWVSMNVEEKEGGGANEAKKEDV